MAQENTWKVKWHLFLRILHKLIAFIICYVSEAESLETHRMCSTVFQSQGIKD